MKYSRNSLLLTAGLFAMAAAIAFHAWWPAHVAAKQEEGARTAYMEYCVANKDNFFTGNPTKAEVERDCLAYFYKERR